MNKIKYFILVLILWNLPEYLLNYWGPSLGSIASYMSSLSILAFFFLVKEKHRLLFPFILLGLLYFVFSAFQLAAGVLEREYLTEFLRFMIVVVCAGELLHRTTKKEIFYILIVGGLSIIINAFVFPDTAASVSLVQGRPSGFYINPNSAGSICLVGYALSYVIENKRIRILGQIIFTLAGLLTLSRTFIVVWLLVSFIAIYKSRKNLIAPVIGGLTLILFFAVSSSLSLNKPRFRALVSIFSSDKVDTQTISKDSRTHTWSLHTDAVMENPIFGNGFKSLQIRKNGRPGVHNSYLMVIGEAGIIPFLLMIGIYTYLIVLCLRNFKNYPEYLYIICILCLILAAGHQFFRNFLTVLMSMFVFIELQKIEVQKNIALSEQ